MNLDEAIVGFDRMLRTLFAPAKPSRPRPGIEHGESALDDIQRREVAALMRVNHCGEVCAQGLYQGQALTAREPHVRVALEQAAREEADHLAWTGQRIVELGGRESFLSPVFYVASVAMGAAAGKLGDGWNLGFLVETERQVERHLQGHMDRLPASDQRSRAILEQMQIDEGGHAQTALDLGARMLPLPARGLMNLAARVMTGTTYWV